MVYRVELALEVGIFVLFPGLARVGVKLELFDLDGGITINASHGHEANSIMMGYPLNTHFLLPGRHQFKQTKNPSF